MPTYSGNIIPVSGYQNQVAIEFAFDLILFRIIFIQVIISQNLKKIKSWRIQH
ncbi:hypothetical protein BH09BAC5_BH09BAC5_21650 [soil metagenome]